MTTQHLLTSRETSPSVTTTTTNTVPITATGASLETTTQTNSKKQKKRVAFLKSNPKNKALYGADSASDTGMEADDDDDDDDDNDNDNDNDNDSFQGDDNNNNDDDDDDDEDEEDDEEPILDFGNHTNEPELPDRINTSSLLFSKTVDLPSPSPTASSSLSSASASSSLSTSPHQLRSTSSNHHNNNNNNNSKSTTTTSNSTTLTSSSNSSGSSNSNKSLLTSKSVYAHMQNNPPVSQLLYRGFVLFICGVFFSLLFNLLQRQHHVTQFPSNVSSLSIFSSVWWVPAVCGMAAILVGFAYPYIDYTLGSPHVFKREWSSVMRCVGVFIGINYASAKLPFSTNIQLSLMLALMAIALWWMFDRTIRGFIMGLIVALGSTLAIQLLVFFGAFRYTQPDFLWVRSWIPCIFFAAGINFGCIGRQLAFDSQIDFIRKLQKKLN